MSDEYFEELEQWRRLVGTAILAFGEIELVTLKCLEHLPNDNIYRSTSSLPLGRRIDLVVDILESRESDAEFETFLGHLKRAKKLSEYRNLLAHNPLVADVFQHRVTGDLDVQRLIRSARDGQKAIDLSELKELADEVEDLASELWMAVAEIAKREVWGHT